MKRLLPKLTARLHPYKEGARLLEVPPFVSEIPASTDSAITHEWLWPRVGKFFKPKDIIIAETGEHCLCQSIFGSTLGGNTDLYGCDVTIGTSSFGIVDIPLPTGAIFISQILWGSIGWTTGSTLGAALAGRDLGLGRPILFIGDGSMYVCYFIIKRKRTELMWNCNFF